MLGHSARGSRRRRAGPAGSWVEITDGKALLKGTTERPHYAVGGLLNLQTRSGAPTCSGLWSERERKVYGFF